MKALQVFLNSVGILISQSGPGSSGNESNYFGQATYNALVKFQKVHVSEIFGTNLNLSGLGIFGPKTRAIVESIVDNSK